MVRAEIAFIILIYYFNLCFGGACSLLWADVRLSRQTNVALRARELLAALQLMSRVTVTRCRDGV